VSFEGSLLVVGLREVLQHLDDGRGTGILTLQNDREILAVTFQRGEIVGADSLAEGEEALGSLLATERLVEPQDFAAVVAAQRTGGGRIPDLLLERGLIERSRLLGALRRHTLRLVLDVLAWRDGAYKFYAGEEVSFEEGFDPIPIEEVLALAPAGAGERGGSTWPRAAARAASALAPATPVGGALRGLETLPEVPSGAVSEAPPAPRGVFVPPSPGAPAQPAMRAATTARGSAGRARAWRWQAVASTGLGLAVLLGLAGWFASRPAALLVAVPWSQSPRHEFAASQRLAAFEQIDVAARAFFFVQGRYPADLQELVETGLLAQRATVDAEGRPLRFTSNGPLYTLEAGADRGEGVAIGAVSTVAGDLFLDTTLFEAETDGQQVPLVLVD
jgi:hypothetical protein